MRAALRVLLLMAVAGSLSGAAFGQVVINELMYHPVSDDNDDEFLELLNTGAAAVDLTGWCIDGIAFCFPAAASIGPGQYLVLARNGPRFLATYGFDADHIYTGKLDNSGERIALLGPSSQTMDAVSYTDLPPWPVTPDGLGPSLELIDPAELHDTPRNWQASNAGAGHTAGLANSVAAAGLPPWISNVTHLADPAPSVPVDVTAQVADATTVELSYKLDFGPEVALAMLDDGASGDGAAGDGIYGAEVPGQPAGTLVRYRIHVAGPTGTMDYPRDDDTVLYDGTVVADPALSTSLPLFQWHMDPADYADALAHRYTDQLEPAVLYYDTVLYDNIRVRVRGQSSRSYPKNHWKFLLPHGHDLFDPSLVPVPVDQFNMQSNYSDKSFMREQLSYDSFLETGTPANIAFNVRLHQNGEFFGLFTFLQSMDDDYLQTNGIDPNGAWYKAFDTCVYRTLSGLTGRYEKKTRLYEDYSDLHAFLDGVNNLSGQAHTDFLYDNIDIPAMANYLATTVVIHNTDFPHKNYFIYRDTEGTGRWTMHPWDMDLTFGRNWQGTVLNDEIWADRDSIDGRPAEVAPSHPLVGEEEHKNWDTRWNHMIDALYEDARFEQMYHRRLRTLMDEMLAPGRYEAIIDAQVPLIQAEADLDRARWGQYGASQTLAEAIALLTDDYLNVRRTHLFSTHRVAGEIPEAQSANPRVVINELMYNPAGLAEDEFVELYNPSSDEAVDLSGWRLDGIGLTIPPGTVLLPQDYVVFARGDAQFRATYGGGKFVGGEYTGNLRSEGEAVVLRDRDGNVVSQVAYSNLAPWPAAPDGGGPSLELVDPDQANGWVANWSASLAVDGTPGAANSAAGVIPLFPGLFINEVLPVNLTINVDEQGEYEPWIEIYNGSGATVDLGGMFLTPSLAEPARWAIPPGTDLCAGCWMLFWADAETADGPLHTDFTLAAGGGTAALYDAGGMLIDYLIYEGVVSNTSFGRFPDGQPDARSFTEVTPADANDARPVPMILNEYNAVETTRFLESGGVDSYWGRVMGNGGNWFELVVTEDRLDARGWRLVMTNDTGGPSEVTYALVLSNDPIWSDLAAGTIITVSEQLDDDVSYGPWIDDWWINVRASNAAPGTYITPLSFPVSNDSWQLTIEDETGEAVFGPAGEGVMPVSGIGGDEVCKLEEPPGPFTTPLANYNDGSSSTFGAPNRYAGGTLTQDFSTLRCNNENCRALDSLCGVGVCDGSTGQCAVLPRFEGLGCDDGNSCTSGDQCTAGYCTGVALDCGVFDDACNVGICDPGSGSCEAQPVNEGLACDDGDGCTGGDSCAAGVCAGAMVDCDDGSVCSVDSCDGACNHVASGACGISGTVVYYRQFGVAEPGAGPVPGLEIDVDGDLLADAVTDAAGAYAAGNLFGWLDVSVLDRFGDGQPADHNGAITSFDAAFIAQHAVQMITLSTNQRLAGDVSGNGQVSSFDAAKVAQFATSQIEHFGVALTTGSDWKLLRCDNYVDEANHDCGDPLFQHLPLLQPEVDGFYAILYGDVTGNWSAPGSRSASTAEGLAAEEDRLTAVILASLPAVPRGRPEGMPPAAMTLTGASGVLRAGERRDVTLRVDRADGIEGLDLVLSFDPDEIEILGVRAAGLALEGVMDLAAHAQDGRQNVALYGPLPLTGSGPLLELTIRARRELRSGPAIHLDAQANEGRIPLDFPGRKRPSAIAPAPLSRERTRAPRR